MQILSGRITCTMQTMFTHDSSAGDTTQRTTYNDQQTLVWSWSNTPPLLVSNTLQSFWVAWSARGAGFKQFRQESTNHTQEGNDTWTVNFQSTLQLTARQTGGVIALSSQETTHLSGITVWTSLVVDNMPSGPPKMTSWPAIALAVSIDWNPPAATDDPLDRVNRLDPVSLVPPRSPRLLGDRLNRPRVTVVRGSMPATLSPPKGPDAPLSQYPTTASWFWEITTTYV